IAGRPQRHLDRKLRSVATKRTVFHALIQTVSIAGLDEPRKALTMLFAMGLGQDRVGEHASERFLAGPAKHRFRAFVPFDDAAAIVRSDEPIVRRSDNGARAFLAFE